MSAEAVTVVLHHSQAEGTAKLVLWGIANHHGDGGAWPSIATLAKYANIKERRVQQIIRELAAMGEIAIDEQGGLGQGQYKTNRYHILIQCPSDCDGSLNHRTGVQSVTSGVQSEAVRGAIWSPSGVQPTAPELNIELKEEPNISTQTLFDEFWAIYPKKVDKAIAYRSFKKALGRVTFEDILAGVIRFANDPNLPSEKRFIKNPATWLNAEAWENPPLPEIKGRKSSKEEQKRKLDEWLASIDE